MNTFISPRLPTLREVAKAAGVGLATASYALRGHRTVSGDTRAKVRATAERMGYRVNPQLAAFMQARRTGRSMRTDATVALIYGGPRRPVEGSDYFGGCLKGLRALASERGYALDLIAWNEKRDASGRKLARNLEGRGIRGLLLMPPDGAGRWRLPLDWSRFSGVALDHSLDEARVHRVADHYAADMATALEKVKSAGRSRPGLVLEDRNNNRTLEMRLGAYLARTGHDFPAAPPPLVLRSEADRTAPVRKWLARHSPDVVLAPDNTLAPVLAREKTAFVSLANYGAPGEPPGVLIDAEGVGRTAAFLLFSLLENPAAAMSPRPLTILIEGRWNEASPLPRKKTDGYEKRIFEKL